MYRTLVIRAGWVLMCLFAFATASFSQASSTSRDNANPSVEIIYTGKLLGYFRVRAGQSRDRFRGCKPPTSIESSSEMSTANDSEAATKFLEKRKKNPGAILVGTGDNFAPQLEARVFAPEDTRNSSGPYPTPNKELYYGDGDHWVFYKDLPKELQDRQQSGLGTIPTDNVGCFLATAQFAAVVPGKHDFYFGAERVRQLARFMASITPSKEHQPVQMLGANLVIKTVRADGQVPQPDPRSKPDFKTDWPKEYPVQNLADGRSVYPWFSYVHIKFAEFKAKSTLLETLMKRFPSEQSIKEDDFLKQLGTIRDASPEDQEELDKLKERVQEFEKVPLYVCQAVDDPNDIKIDNTCLLKKRVRISGNTLVYDVPLKELPPGPKDPPRKNGHFVTLMHSHNYGLCLKQNEEQPNKSLKEVTYCLRFSVHTPFFYFPDPAPSIVKDIEPPTIDNSYTDPDPFVLLPKGGDQRSEVAIFGVVDTTIGEQVGALNFSWLKNDDKFTTVVSAEDPGEALKEQLDYFERWYKTRNCPVDSCKSEVQKPFSGLKILLAQMSPQRARVFAARFPEFQVVVTAADQDQTTSETKLTTLWTDETRKGTFVAVPSPYYDTNKKQGIVHFGWVEASPKGTSWKLIGKSSEPDSIDPTKSLATKFWVQVAAVLPECLTPDFEPNPKDKPEDRDRLKWLTLCVMRKRTGADIALLQKRDFFDRLPKEAGDAPENVQQILDRIIWKGDLLTLLYVPGSALKKALDLSKKFDADDANLLSLADERLRGLETLGIEKVKDEYLVNEVPLDEKKIYAVATTDYIGAGDTGYPDLATAAINPKMRASQFPETLETISSIVCGALYPDHAHTYCLDEIKRDNYLDRTVAEAAPSYEQPGLLSKLWKVFPFKAPAADKEAKSTLEALKQQAQRRPIWLFSLKNFSVQFSSLNNNRTDADIDAKFSGVPTSGVTTHKTRSLTIGLDTRLSRTSHKHEIFIASGIDYSEKSIGVANTFPQITQTTNRLNADAGFIRDIYSRSLPHFGIVLSVHGETPFQRPLTTFSLGTQTTIDQANNIKVTDRLQVYQPRGFLFLPRAGLRWQNRTSSLEIGTQAGWEFHALNGFEFNTQGVIDHCLPNAKEPFATCVKKKSTPPNATITKDSIVTAKLQTRPRAGMYWKVNVSIPFNSKVKYELVQDADFFFVDLSRDNTTDTRYRDSSKNSLKFTIWPSITIGPTFRLLLYQNKVNKNFLSQREFGIETSVSFDIFNRREKRVQLKNKP